MDELGGALRELARAAHAPTAADPAELWQRGRKRVRRRRLTGAAVGAVVAALLAFVVIDVPEPTVVMPAGKPHAPAIPKNIYEPNRFLAGVSDRGAPGQLAAIAQMPGNEEHDGPWYGISATTGEYRILDLPAMAADTAVALSPDGSRLAYWVTGETRKTEYEINEHNPEVYPLREDPVVGVAVYDTRDGSVTRHRVDSDYGLEVDQPGPNLSWLSNENLSFAYGISVSPGGSFPKGAFLWGPVGTTPTPIDRADDFGGDSYAPAFPGDSLVRSSRRDRFEVVDTRGVPTGRSFRLSGGYVGPWTVTLWGDRVVKVGDDTADELAQFRVRVGRDRSDGRPIQLRGIGMLVNPTFLGWVSSGEIFVQASPAEILDGRLERIETSDVDATTIEFEPPGTYLVDLESGKERRVGVAEVQSLQVAYQLLDQPMVQGRKPPSLLWALRVPIAGSVALLAAVAFVLVRRRRRA